MINQLKKIGVIFFLLSIANILHAQQSKYLYERKAGESADNFVARHLPDYHVKDNMAHQVIEGIWGDASKGKKIMVCYTIPMIEEYDRATLVIFQPVGDGKHYIMILSNHIGTPGRYYQGVESIFFMDVNEDGARELCLIERGEIRVPIELEEEDENGKIKKVQTTACCEDEFNTIILEQVKDSENRFLPIVSEINLPDGVIGQEDTAKKVKEQIKLYQNSQ